MKTSQMELAVSRHFNYRTNLIVPNISWGFAIHECDLLIISKSGYATEVEIKVSKSDLKKDQDKKHKHEDKRIKYLYFAIPEKLEKDKDLIPEHAGIIIVKNNLRCKVIKKPVIQNNYKFTLEEQYQIARLGSIRTWKLRTKIKGLESSVEFLKEKLNETTHDNKTI